MYTMLSLLLLLACAPGLESPEPTFDLERVEADCDELVYHDHFLIAAVDDPDAVLEWSSAVSDGDAWVSEPEAVVLYDSGVFVLTGATYCPGGETLRLTWLW